MHDIPPVPRRRIDAGRAVPCLAVLCLVGLGLTIVPTRQAMSQPYAPPAEQQPDDDQGPDQPAPPSYYAPQQQDRASPYAPPPQTTPGQPYAQPSYPQPPYAPPQPGPQQGLLAGYGASCDTGPRTSCALVRQAPLGARCTCPGYSTPTYGSVR